MNGADIIAIMILIAIIIAVLAYLLHWLYRRSSKDVSFVRTGLGGEKVVMGGGALVLPIVHDVTDVSMNTLRLEVHRAREKSLITKDRMRIELQVEFYVRVIPSAEAVAAAARTLGNRTMNPESLRDLVQGRFVDAMGAVAASMTLEQIHEHRSDYIRDVKAQVANSMTQNGLELETASLTNLDQADMKLFNPSNAFDAEGLTRLTEEIESRRKKRNDIEQDTMIAVRKKNLEAERLALDIQRESEYARLEQEREVALRRAQQRAEIAREKVLRDREVEEAEIQAREDIEKARIGQDRAIDAERIARELDLERLEIQRQKARQIEEQESVIAVAQKSKEQSEAQQAAEGARALMIEAQENVTTVRDRAIAERRKQIDIIVASQEAEREAVKIKVRAEAERHAATDRAEADRIEVAALERRFAVEAEGKRKANEAENLRSDASRRSALHVRLIENLPSIIRESVKPMEQIESIRILHVEGLPGLSGPGTQGPVGSGGDKGGTGDDAARAPNLAESVVNSALRYRAQAPFVDTLLNEIGMSPASIGMDGLGGLGKTEYTPVKDEAGKPSKLLETK
ncbi:flotillin family protein [Lichenifustis flavocetrariae]|uniref:SPFH domain-containing protein n=1 Tax=Lichenifustis flavocetrariae TaxID=2949735 RepID=A0AA42CN37_9HYPH|nr:flotillin domain-containing protein [Lichenifustis flavocetrariae]MCW6509002.1 SPFH domain-containing protein [Lichenifustis flavocetrariae]